MTIRRLKSIQNIANLLFVLTGVLMIDNTTHFLRSVFSNQESYVDIIYNKWIVTMMIAVILELYTTYRLSRELNKDDM